MKRALEITLSKDGISFYYPGSGETPEFAREQGNKKITELVTEYCSAKSVSTRKLVFFVAEDLLFFTTFRLPLNTPDVQEAIRLQLGMLTPFDVEAMLYGYTFERSKDGFEVALYAARREDTDEYLKDMIAAGYKVQGVYPESQRFLTRANRRGKWILVIPGGRFVKELVFFGARLKERHLSARDNSHGELAAIFETERIYHLAPPVGSAFLDACRLYLNQPLLNDYNLLPSPTGRVDLIKIATVVLLLLNLTVLFGMIGAKEYQIREAMEQVDSRIKAVQPLVKEVNALQGQVKALEDKSQTIAQFQNPDLIDLLAKLTSELPQHSYLDLIRLDKDQKAINIMGYTDDIGELTTKLQVFGEVKLKSTSRRKNKTYFHLETSLP